MITWLSLTLLPSSCSTRASRLPCSDSKCAFARHNHEFTPTVLFFWSLMRIMFQCLQCVKWFWRRPPTIGLVSPVANNAHPPCCHFVTSSTSTSTNCTQIMNQLTSIWPHVEVLAEVELSETSPGSQGERTWDFDDNPDYHYFVFWALQALCPVWRLWVF